MIEPSSIRAWISFPAVWGTKEYAALAWVDWFNHRRLLGSIGHVPPAELEAAYYQQLAGQVIAA
jgi:transposase InsO family protein